MRSMVEGARAGGDRFCKPKSNHESVPQGEKMSVCQK